MGAGFVTEQVTSSPVQTPDWAAGTPVGSGRFGWRFEVLYACLKPHRGLLCLVTLPGPMNQRANKIKIEVCRHLLSQPLWPRGCHGPSLAGADEARHFFCQSAVEHRLSFFKDFQNAERKKCSCILLDFFYVLFLCPAKGEWVPRHTQHAHVSENCAGQ